MTEEESKPLLDYLLEHGHRPEFTCRFRWETGSIAFWDNRVCKHLAIHDAGPFRRVMRRTQIAGGRVDLSCAAVSALRRAASPRRTGAREAR